MSRPLHVQGSGFDQLMWFESTTTPAGLAMQAKNVPELAQDRSLPGPGTLRTVMVLGALRESTSSARQTGHMRFNICSARLGLRDPAHAGPFRSADHEAGKEFFRKLSPKLHQHPNPEATPCDGVQPVVSPGEPVLNGAPLEPHSSLDQDDLRVVCTRQISTHETHDLDATSLDTAQMLQRFRINLPGPS